MSSFFLKKMNLLRIIKNLETKKKLVGLFWASIHSFLKSEKPKIIKQHIKIKNIPSYIIWILSKSKI